MDEAVSGSEAFLHALRETGYYVDGLEKKDFIWLDHPKQSIAIFMSWFAQNIGSNNFVKPELLKLYREMKRNDEILSGKELNDALIKFQDRSLGPQFKEPTEIDLECAKDLVAQHCEHSNYLEVHIHCLRIELENLKRKLAKLIKEHKMKAINLKDALTVCAKRHLKLNREVKELTDALGKLFNFICSLQEKGDTYFVQASFDDFLKMFNTARNEVLPLINDRFVKLLETTVKTLNQEAATCVQPLFNFKDDAKVQQALCYVKWLGELHEKLAIDSCRVEAELLVAKQVSLLNAKIKQRRGPASLSELRQEFRWRPEHESDDDEIYKSLKTACMVRAKSEADECALRVQKKHCEILSTIRENVNKMDLLLAKIVHSFSIILSVIGCENKSVTYTKSVISGIDSELKDTLQAFENRMANMDEIREKYKTTSCKPQDLLQHDCFKNCQSTSQIGEELEDEEFTDIVEDLNKMEQKVKRLRAFIFSAPNCQREISDPSLDSRLKSTAKSMNSLFSEMRSEEVTLKLPNDKENIAALRRQGELLWIKFLADPKGMVDMVQNLEMRVDNLKYS